MSLRKVSEWSPDEEAIITQHIKDGRDAIRRALARAGFYRSLNAIKGHIAAMKGKK